MQKTQKIFKTSSDLFITLFMTECENAKSRKHGFCKYYPTIKMFRPRQEKFKEKPFETKSHEWFRIRGCMKGYT